jgi:hypothetical protein
MFGPSFKTKENQEEVRQIWLKYQSGLVDRDTAINLIMVSSAMSRLAQIAGAPSSAR